MIAIEWGFKSVVLTALILYLLSAIIYHRIGRDWASRKRHANNL